MDWCGEPLSLSKAAERLGLTQAAVRKRIKRGTLRADKGPDGTWTVWLTGEEPAKPASPDGLGDGTPNRDLVSALRDEVSFLRDELRRKDVIISQFAGSMTEVRELVASVPMTTVNALREQQDVSPPPTVEREGGLSLDRQPTPGRSGMPWWQRLFR